MKSYIAFTKKEFCENFRTYKFLIMIIVFLLIGMMNPIIAKTTPQLLTLFIPDGMNITIAEPTALDSWTQFYKNVSQMGLIVLVIMFSGMMATEFSRGTLINMLTKGLPRRIVILSKLTMASLIWILSYAICFATTYGYTIYFWRGERISNIVFAAFCLWLFGLLLITIMLFGGVIFKSTFGGLLLTGGVVLILLLLNMVPKFQEYNPITLSSSNMMLLTNEQSVSDFLPSIIIGCIMSILFIFSAIKLFNKKQL